MRSSFGRLHNKPCNTSLPHVSETVAEPLQSKLMVMLGYLQAAADMSMCECYFAQFITALSHAYACFAGGVAALACNEQGLLASSCHSGTLSFVPSSSKDVAAGKYLDMRLLLPNPTRGTLRVQQPGPATVPADRWVPVLLLAVCWCVF